MGLELLNLTLLYVEDDEDTRDSLTQVFNHKVKNVLVAKDGVEALEIFKKNKVHFIISDYQMPKMNGNELCEEIKRLDSSVPFVMLTAFNDTKLLISSIDSGVDKFLQKPVEADKLFLTIDTIYEKIVKQFQLEKSTVCLQEAEKIALLSYWDINLNNNIINFSPEAKELFSMEKNEKSTYIEFAEMVNNVDKDKFIEIFKTRVFEEESIDEVISIKSKENQNIFIHIVAKRWKSSICGNNHIIGLFQDVSRYEIQKQKLLKENRCDGMLNISNKKFIMYQLENLIESSRRYGHSIGVIFFDIDDFKRLNTQYGHLVADDILIELARIIKLDIRKSDYFGRWGGDEFIVVTGYSSQESTIEFAKKIEEKIEKHNWKLGIKISLSIGVSFYQIGDDVQSIIDKADTKMYEAKKSGKNKICF